MIPAKYWPVIGSVAVFGFQLVWDATAYQNPIAEADVAGALVSGGLAFEAMRRMLAAVDKPVVMVDQP